VLVLLFQYEKVAKLTSDAKFETSDIKASVAAIAFILSSAAKHSVDGSSLDNEMQQLGLPKGTTCTCNPFPYFVHCWVVPNWYDVHTFLYSLL
jgi:hypothetical protein